MKSLVNCLVRFAVFALLISSSLHAHEMKPPICRGIDSARIMDLGAGGFTGSFNDGSKESIDITRAYAGGWFQYDYTVTQTKYTLKALVDGAVTITLDPILSPGATTGLGFGIFDSGNNCYAFPTNTDGETAYNTKISWPKADKDDRIIKTYKLTAGKSYDVHVGSNQLYVSSTKYKISFDFKPTDSCVKGQINKKISLGTTVLGPVKADAGVKRVIYPIEFADSGDFSVKFEAASGNGARINMAVVDSEIGCQSLTKFDLVSQPRDGKSMTTTPVAVTPSTKKYIIIDNPDLRTPTYTVTFKLTDNTPQPADVKCSPVENVTFDNLSFVTNKDGIVTSVAAKASTRKVIAVNIPTNLLTTTDYKLSWTSKGTTNAKYAVFYNRDLTNSGYVNCKDFTNSISKNNIITSNGGVGDVKPGDVAYFVVYNSDEFVDGSATSGFTFTLKTTSGETPKVVGTPPPNGAGGKCNEMPLNPEVQINGDKTVHFMKDMGASKYLDTVSFSVDSKAPKGTLNNYKVKVTAELDGTIYLSSTNPLIRHVLSDTDTECGTTGVIQTKHINAGDVYYIGMTTDGTANGTITAKFIPDKLDGLYPNVACSNGIEDGKDYHQYTQTAKEEVKFYKDKIAIDGNKHVRKYYKFKFPLDGEFNASIKNLKSDDKPIGFWIIRGDEPEPLIGECAVSAYFDDTGGNTVDGVKVKKDQIIMMYVDTPRSDIGGQRDVEYELEAIYYPKIKQVKPEDDPNQVVPVDPNPDKWAYPSKPVSPQVPNDGVVPARPNDAQPAATVYNDQDFFLVYGGAGSFVNGDMLTTGASVICSGDQWGCKEQYSGRLWDSYGYYVTKNKVLSGDLNGDKAYISLPDGLKGSDVKIRYARLYWQGHIHHMSVTRNALEVQARGRGRYFTQGEFRSAIKGYRSMNFRAGNKEHKRVGAQQLNVIYTVNVFPTSQANGLVFNYGASSDVTKQVAEYIEGSDQGSFEFTGGDIKTSDGPDPAVNRKVFQIDQAECGYGVSLELCNYQKVDTLKLGSYGGWTLVVVYDVDRVKKPDYLKAKQVSVYAGYKLAVPKLANGAKSEVEISLKGFFTPLKPGFDAKVAYNAFAGERGTNGGTYGYLGYDTLQIINAAAGGECNKSDGTINDISKCPYKVIANDAFASSMAYQRVKGSGNTKTYPFYTQEADGGTFINQLPTAKYHGGMDLEVYQVGKYMAPMQSATKFKLYIPGSNQGVDQSYVGMMAFSTDLYVPDLCFEENVYNTEGWTGFFDPKTGARRPKANFDKPITNGSIVAGEQLYYRTKFENRGDADAVGVYVKIDMGRYNNYVPQSSTIDNTLLATDIAKANFAYLSDNDKGAFSDMFKKSPIANPVYKEKQLNSFLDNELTFYVGKDAGIVKSGKPGGGLVKEGARDKIFVEYNATVGRNYKYMFTQYKVGFSAKDPTSGETVANFDYGIGMRQCSARVRDIRVTLLNGLKVVNQNFNKTDNKLAEDDRLYTQIAENKFDAKLIYKPDLSSLFPCKKDKFDEKGKCTEYDFGDIDEDFIKKFFNCTKLEGTKCIEGSIKEGLQPFELDGNMYVSLLRANDAGGAECYAATNKEKIPFVYEGKRYKDLKVDMNKKSLIELDNLEVEDAFKGVTYMISYFPKGLESSVSDDLSVPDSTIASMTDEEKEAYLKGVKEAELTLGVKQSRDGSFHVCASDLFSVRPAYYEIKPGAITKEAKFVNTEASGDITKAVKTINGALRVGGNWEDNEDIVFGAIAPKSAKGHNVPNYSEAVIGGDLGAFDYDLKKGYNYTSDYELYKATKQNIDDKLKRNYKLTYLKPFISNECRTGLKEQSFYVPRNGVVTKLGVGNSEDNPNKGGKPYSYSQGMITCAGKVDGKCFDEVYARVWDKDKISLFVDFSRKDRDGKVWTKDELAAEAQKAAASKSASSALIHTARLMDASGKEIKKVFNYFNVGDVLVNIRDNTWTDGNGDQAWSKQFDAPSCVLGSTSLKADANGMVGCEIGMKDDESLVLRYVPQRVVIDLKGLKNSNTNGGLNPFTYFTRPKLPCMVESLIDGANDYSNTNKALVDNTDNLASLNFTSTAFLDDKNYVNTVATLFDGREMRSYNNDIKDRYRVPLCGFAMDIDTKLNFSFDCSAKPTDPRCAENPVTTKEQAATVYKPYADIDTYEVSLPKISYISEEDCKDTKGTNNIRFDSRCFLFDARSLVSGVESEDYTSTTSVPLNKAINYYSFMSEDSGILNTRQVKTLPVPKGELAFDPKLPHYTFVKEGYQSGSGKNLNTFVNFDRNEKRPSLPVWLMASDFNFDGATLSNTISTPGFDKDGDMITKSDTSYKPTSLDSDDKMVDGLPYPKFAGVPVVHTSNYTSKDIPTVVITNNFAGNNVKNSALFVYGTINHEPEGKDVTGDKSGFGVDITSYIYCPHADGCASMPVSDTNSSTIFTRLKASGAAVNGEFVTNIYDIYPTIIDFVERYRVDNSKANDPIRGNVLLDGRETITLSSKKDSGYKTLVSLDVKPWFVYTKNMGSSGRVYGNPTPVGIGTCPVATKNFFGASFTSLGVWGGKGGVKGADDQGNVGNVVGGGEKLQDVSRKSGGRINW